MSSCFEWVSILQCFDPPLIQPLIASLSRHTRFGPADLEAFARLPARIVEIPARRDFVRLGDQTSEASFVIDGLLGRFDQNRNGDRQVVALYLAGDLPDLHSVALPYASSALHAFTDGRLIRVPHSALLEAAQEHAAIALAFWRESALDAVRVSKWVLSVGRSDALSRMAHLICEVACRSTGRGRPGAVEIGFPVTQTDLGDMLGLSPVHINRTLKSLRLANLVTVDRTQVKILDWDKLARIADFDARYLSLPTSPEPPGRDENTTVWHGHVGNSLSSQAPL